jgi:hypothetical protein
MKTGNFFTETAFFYFFLGNGFSGWPTTDLHRRSGAPCLALKTSETANVLPPPLVLHLVLLE